MKCWTDPKSSFSDNGKNLLLIVGQGAHKRWMVKILAEVICTTLRPDIRVPTDLHMTIRQKYMILFHLIFFLCTTIRPKIRVLNNLFLLCAHDHSTEIYGPLWFTLFFVHDHSTKTRVLTDLFLLFSHDQSTKIYVPVSFNLSIAHDHLTRI